MCFIQLRILQRSTVAVCYVTLKYSKQSMPVLCQQTNAEFHGVAHWIISPSLLFPAINKVSDMIHGRCVKSLVL